MTHPKPLHLRLPATSANLGPGFDALGLAMALYLTIDASPADAFHIDATGRDAILCADIEDNLILTTYIDVLAARGIFAPRLHLRLQNEIPLGMGCGSSASALLAGVMLANHFGNLHWTTRQILEEACSREGHPDNVAACLLGGMTVSAMTQAEESKEAAPQPSPVESVTTATCGETLDWALLLVLPKASLATSKARALLPATYSRQDAVANIQSTALLVAAFAQDRPELLRIAMRDRIHQPYRMTACPLLSALLPLAETNPAIYGAALSGAGPSVLLIVDPSSLPTLIPAIRQAAADPTLEVLQTRISTGAVSGN
jgi:homoserine kinase